MTARLSAWQRDKLHALAETPNLTADEYDRRKAEIQAATKPPMVPPARHRKGWSSRDIRLLRDNRHQSLDDLAELLGRSQRAVEWKLRTFGWSRPVRPSRGAGILQTLQSTPGIAWAQADLARASGCSRQVTNAVLGALRAAGVVTVERVDGLLMFKTVERGDA